MGRRWAKRRRESVRQYRAGGAMLLHFFSVDKLALTSATIFLLAAVSSSDPGSSDQYPVVHTTLGRIRGVVRTYGSATISEFLGVRYAQPPTGNLRFAKPLPVDAWGPTTYDALSYGAWCPQSVAAGQRDRTTTSEDCLFLNVYVPYDNPFATGSPDGTTVNASSTPGLRAVVVFIHGGSFQSSSSSRYTGAALAAFGDVIAVTVNYRLNVFGFLSTGDDEAPGNSGLWDQRQALLWVREHISAFGGDPKRITLLGQSAGAASVNYLAVSPRNNRTLFQRVIAQSGSLHLPRVFEYSPLAVARQLAGLLQCPSGNDLSGSGSAAIVRCLRDRNATELFAAAKSLRWYPMADGDLIVDTPKTLLQKVASADRSRHVVDFAKYDYLTGFNSQEAIWYVDRSSAVPSINEVSKDMTGKDVRNGATKEVYFRMLRLIGEYLFKDGAAVDLFVDRLSSMYETIHAARLESRPPNNRDRLRLFMEVLSDFGWTMPTLQTANLHAQLNYTSNRYFYVYDVKRSFSMPRSVSWDGPDWLRTGAAHTDEVSTTLGYPLLQGLLPNDTFIKEFNYTDAERRLSLTIIRYWTNFAKTGDPNRGVPLSSPWRNWPQYDEKNKKFLHIMMNQSVEKRDPKPLEDNFWNVVVAPNRDNLGYPGSTPEPTVETTTGGSDTISEAKENEDDAHFKLLVAAIGIAATLFVISVALNVALARKLRRLKHASSLDTGKMVELKASSDGVYPLQQ